MTPDAEPDGGVETAWLAAPGSNEGAGLRQVATVAATEYRLAVRNRWALALTVVFAAFALGLATFSGASVAPQGYGRVVASLAVLAAYLVPMAALAFGYDAIVGAAENGWLQALFALPIARWRVVLGAALGRAVALASAIALGFGIAGISLLGEFGFAGWHTYVGFLFATAGLGLAFLAIAVALSTVAREKTHALGAALLAWAWFVLVHDLVALGVIATVDLPEVAISAMVLANPAGIYRVLVLGSLGAAGDAGFASVLATTGLSTPVLIAALVAWIVVPTALATRFVTRRRV